MADEIEYLTEEQKDAFLRWLEAKGQDHKCPVCGHDHWQMGPCVVNAFPQGKRVQLTGKVYPQVFVVCENCYSIQYFLANAPGILGEEDKTSEENSDG